MADTHGVPGGPQGIRLANGTRLNDLDAVVLAQGHVSARLTPQQERTASLARIHHLTYLTPANPAEVDLSGIGPGEPVLLRGLGLNFFDYMALLTAGRGGTFERDRGPAGLPAVRPGTGAVRQLPARRALPRPRREREGRVRPVPAATADAGADRRAARARGGRPPGALHRRDLWPLIAREVESVYYETLLAASAAATSGRRSRRSTSTDPLDDAGPLLDAFGIGPDRRWDWELVCPAVPRAASSPTAAAFRAWLLEYLAADVAHARAGNVRGPLKAALDVLRDLRNEVRLAVDHGGLEGDSHRDDLEGWYTPLNAYLSIGPPASRIEEMIALIEAGVLELTGPGTQIRIDTAEPTFVAGSTEVPGPPVRATVLIEARLPEPDLRRTVDPLLRHLLDTDQAAPYRIAGQGGTVYETGGLAVTERPYRLLDAQGRRAPAAVRLRRADRGGALGDRGGHPAGRGLGDPGRLRRDRPRGARAAPGDAGAGRGAPGGRRDRPHRRDRVTIDVGLLSPVRAGTPAEAALARAQAGLGTVPAERITAAALVPAE